MDAIGTRDDRQIVAQSSLDRRAATRDAPSKPERLRIDAGLEAAVDGQIGPVDPARAVGAKEQNRRRDVGRRSRPPDARDVVIDARVAEYRPEFPQDRRRHRPRTDRVDPDAARLEQRLMGGALRP